MPLGPSELCSNQPCVAAAFCGGCFLKWELDANKLGNLSPSSGCMQGRYAWQPPPSWLTLKEDAALSCPYLPAGLNVEPYCAAGYP